MSKGADKADDLIKQCVTIINGGFDSEVAMTAVADSMAAMKAQAAWLRREAEDALSGKNKRMDEMRFDQIARGMSSITKAMDDTIRLMAFMDAGGDKGTSGGDILAGLKDWQIDKVNVWLTENENEPSLSGQDKTED